MILTATASTTINNSQLIDNDFAAGYFDASIGLPARYINPEYYQGYLAYTAETGNTPF
ncbi:hypothetical protein [Anabaena azotica]|uniref:Uncharacterized protein n=1 Tax=Anabaena azotica FACHB-119 TaxID=947527 RepID=A0ABR8DDT7_9NOST|nr:hypothetical protein [Anabaena azotica]MBD2503888.1 hypothetical protein [Anabaena azotica FACHB-119]